LDPPDYVASSLRYKTNGFKISKEGFRISICCAQISGMVVFVMPLRHCLHGLDEVIFESARMRWKQFLLQK